jgi:NADH-quinone oxidoreductase subunit F
MNHLANNMGITPGTTICGLADGAAWPIKNAIAKYRDELEEFIKNNQNPAARITAAQDAISRGASPIAMNSSMFVPGIGLAKAQGTK